MTNSARNTLVTAATFVVTALAVVAINLAPAAAAKSRAMSAGYNVLDQSVQLPDGSRALDQSGYLPDGAFSTGGSVIFDGSVIGADPDQNIRTQLLRDPIPDRY